MTNNQSNKPENREQTFDEKLDAIFKTLNNKAREERASCTERNNWDGHNSAYERLEYDAKQAIKTLVLEDVIEASRADGTFTEWNGLGLADIELQRQIINPQKEGE